MLRTAEAGQPALELGDLGTHDPLARVHRAHHRPVDALAQPAALGQQVDEGDGGHGSIHGERLKAGPAARQARL